MIGFKTDRRDAINLAKLHRAGELTPVWVPDPAHEAIRDLVRARLAAVRVLRQARQQLSGFLLRYGHHYNRPAWTLMHRRWLAGLTFEQAVHYIVLEDCIAAVEAATARRDRLEAHIEAALSDWNQYSQRVQFRVVRDSDIEALERTRMRHDLRLLPCGRALDPRQPLGSAVGPDGAADDRAAKGAADAALIYAGSSHSSPECERAPQARA